MPFADVQYHSAGVRNATGEEEEYQSIKTDLDSVVCHKQITRT